MLSRDQILTRVDLPREEVPIPEWGEGEVAFVRVLTVGERDRWEEKHFTPRRHVRASMIALTLCDADGKRVFADGDIPAVDNLPSTVAQRLFEVALRLNGMAAEHVQDAKKNSEESATSS